MDRDITAHHHMEIGEDGSRPQGPPYPRNNTKNIDYTTSE